MRQSGATRHIENVLSGCEKGLKIYNRKQQRSKREYTIRNSGADAANMNLVKAKDRQAIRPDKSIQFVASSFGATAASINIDNS
jgi:hypothetical protein